MQLVHDTIEYASPFGAIQAVEAGYNVYRVVDASDGVCSENLVFLIR
jgi:hypothetical protein